MGTLFFISLDEIYFGSKNSKNREDPELICPYHLPTFALSLTLAGQEKGQEELRDAAKMSQEMRCLLEM